MWSSLGQKRLYTSKRLEYSVWQCGRPFDAVSWNIGKQYSTIQILILIHEINRHKYACLVFLDTVYIVRFQIWSEIRVSFSIRMLRGTAIDVMHGRLRSRGRVRSFADDHHRTPRYCRALTGRNWWRPSGYCSLYWMQWPTGSRFVQPKQTRSSAIAGRQCDAKAWQG